MLIFRFGSFSFKKSCELLLNVRERGAINRHSGFLSVGSTQAASALQAAGMWYSSAHFIKCLCSKVHKLVPETGPAPAGGGDEPGGFGGLKWGEEQKFQQRSQEP